MKKLVYFLLLFQASTLQAQDIRWWNPANNEFNVIEGQAWSKSVEQAYDRLPISAKGQVRESVWGLSKHSAGLMIRFRSNASEIKIRYSTHWDKTTPQIDYGMNHMPATGVSGIDLYTLDADGNELWCTGTRNFADTIIYTFDGLRSNDKYHDLGREYRLYLPLYNQVEWLEIGTTDSTFFRPLTVRKDRPIVVYGTSIAQGACASRPGMAWTAQLSRKMDRPLINLAFSGNGRLEPEVIDYLGQIDAKVFIFDCLPNLTTLSWDKINIKDGEQLKQIIKKAVRQLRDLKPNTPILLVDHAGYAEALVKDMRKEAYSIVNQIQQEAFSELKKEGLTNIHYLSKEEIGFELDDTVDGTHPNDIGMQHYAKAYETKLRVILKEPIGQASTSKPVIQYREPHKYDWEDRHIDILNMNIADPAKTAFFGNSIIHFWGGLPRSETITEEESWEKYFTPKGIRNFAYGWDRLENVLWRIYHGELDDISPNKVTLMIGTNNLHLNTDKEIVEGLQFIINAIKERQPTSKIILLGILPRRNYEERIVSLNHQIAKLNGVNYKDLGLVFLKKDKKINEALFSDGLHPNKAGYEKFREELITVLNLIK
jgi:lysophospholipase L1-like esterase